jgi:hypothetical protein
VCDILRADLRQLRARHRNPTNILQLSLLWERPRSRKSCQGEGAMLTFYTQWDIGETMLLRCGKDGPFEGQPEPLDRLVSYYNLAIGGRGCIDLCTGRLQQKARMYNRRS